MLGAADTESGGQYRLVLVCVEVVSVISPGRGMNSSFPAGGLSPGGGGSGYRLSPSRSGLWEPSQAPLHRQPFCKSIMCNPLEDSCLIRA